ncbi:MAG TPA: branched-chain amino acid ABC transporter permease, partial [Methylomirabilota bacterium]|nr:branched-chain amino acid ABC transporter permease [Methylomirabilota bacterium]
MNPSLASIGLLVYITGSSILAYLHPQSTLAFLLFEASLLLIYYSPARPGVKFMLGALVLLVLMPILGFINAYYLEISVEVGIYVALALG